MLGLRHKIKRNGVVIWSCSTGHEAANLVKVFEHVEEDRTRDAYGTYPGNYEVVDSRPGIVYNAPLKERAISQQMLTL